MYSCRKGLWSQKNQHFTWLTMNIFAIFFLNFWWLAKARTTMKFVTIPTHPMQIWAIVTMSSGRFPSSAWSFENPTSDVSGWDGELVGLVSSVLCSIAVTYWSIQKPLSFVMLNQCTASIKRLVFFYAVGCEASLPPLHSHKWNFLPSQQKFSLSNIHAFWKKHHRKQKAFLTFPALSSRLESIPLHHA